MPDSHDHDKLHDQLVDQALRETLGNQSPPDLTDVILARCAEDLPQPRSDAMTEPSPYKLRRALAWATAASVLFCLGALARPAIDAAGAGAWVVEAEEVQAGNQPSIPTPPSAAKDDLEPLAEEPRMGVKKNREDRVAPTDSKEVRLQTIDDQLPSPYYRSDDMQLSGPADPAPATDPASPTSRREPLSQPTITDRQFAADSSEAITEGRKGESNRPTATPPSNPETSDPYANTVFGIDAILTYGDEDGDIVPATEEPALPAVAKPPAPSNRRGVMVGQRFNSSNGSTPELFGTETFGFDNRRTKGLSLLRERIESEPSCCCEEPGLVGQGPGQSGDKYTRIHENPFVKAAGLNAVSTFSIDVDTASYTNVRQFLNSGHFPPPDAVRLEELINYFDYSYEPPSDALGEQVPFASQVEVTGCPWAPEHRLVRIGVKGQEMEVEERPLSNLVFLIDVSGSMQDANKLPLVREGMKALVRQLGENDRISIVVYASSEGLVLPSTPGDQQETILAALDGLAAGGSTAGGAGIRLAYQMAEDHFIQGGANRVILCTDGDFNVGTTSTGDLERLVTEKAKQTGVFLSVCGFGRGNLNDAMMETISNQGNGNYYYIDSQNEAERVFVKGLTGTLVTIAKDVKVQVEFNPARVAGYRLLGYENRMLAAQDFNDDKKDAGEIGAGHTVTALYEVVPAGKQVPAPGIDELRYQQPPAPIDEAVEGEMLTLKMRYKLPHEDVSTKHQWPVTDEGTQFGAASADLQFAAAVAGFGMLLRDSQHAGNLTWDTVLEIAQGASSRDPDGLRAEFRELVSKAKKLSGKDKD